MCSSDLVRGIVNYYMTFRGLLCYGFENDARELAEKAIRLFGRDLERFGALHDQPDNGEPILNRGFQNWNYLVLNMIAWYRGEHTIAELQPTGRFGISYCRITSYNANLLCGVPIDTSCV